MMTVLWEQQISILFYSLQTIHLPFGLPSHLFSLTIAQNNDNNKKKSHKKFCEHKQKHVEKELSKTNQTRWKWHHNAFTQHCMFCHFANCALSTKLSTCMLLVAPTKWMHKAINTAHSLPHTRQIISAMFSSNKSSQPNIIWCESIVVSFPSTLVHFWVFHSLMHLFLFWNLFGDLYTVYI